MDIISRAIREGAHLCDDGKFVGQTWEQFQKMSYNKKVFLFGAGGGMGYFLRNFCSCVETAGVVDNDRKKQNRELGWYCEDAWHTEYEEVRTYSPDIFKRYSSQEITVLITALRGYENIIKQLQQIGIINCFVLVIMEANRSDRIEEHIAENPEEQRKQYVQQGMCNEIVGHKIVMHIGEYGGHAMAITNAILKLGNGLDIVWVTRNPDIEVPAGVRLVNEGNRKSYIFEMETAKIWLYDVLVPDYIIKREGQVYIQAKHWAGITLKMFYLDDKSSCTSPQIEQRIRNDGARMDYLLSGSEFDERSCQSGLDFHGKAVRVGSPRSDVLFDDGIKQRVCKAFHLSKDIRILLYAPTYRKRDYDNGRSMKVTLNTELLRDTLAEQWGGDWVVMVRLHPFIKSEKNELQENKWLINAGAYPNSIELVAACDSMITDFSSIMFEGAFIKKPVFLYAPDRKEYIGGERGILLDYDELPFPAAESNEELIQRIRQFDRVSYEHRIENYLEQYGVHEDGYASKRAAEFMLHLINDSAAQDNYICSQPDDCFRMENKFLEK